MTMGALTLKVAREVAAATQLENPLLVRVSASSPPQTPFAATLIRKASFAAPWDVERSRSASLIVRPIVSRYCSPTGSTGWARAIELTSRFVEIANQNRYLMVIS